MAKCLVTGGLGFIGSAVVDELINAGHEVLVVDNLSTGKRENSNPKANQITADILDDTLWKTEFNADYVFHLAALARIQPSIEEPLPSHDTNLTGTLKVLEYARKHKAKVIFSSSSALYEGDTLPTIETATINPKNPYALQKWMCEQYLHLYKELYGLEYAVLRYFNVYGERQILEGAYAAVVGIFLDQKANGKKLTITNDGEQRRDFTYVKDVAKANLMAMEWDGVTNIGTGRNYSINDLAEMIEGEKEYIGNREGEAEVTLADNYKARQLGWQPTKYIREWVDETLGR